MLTEHWDRIGYSLDLYRMLKMNWKLLSMPPWELKSSMERSNWCLLRMTTVVFVQARVHLEILYAEFVHFLASFVLSLPMSVPEEIKEMKRQTLFLQK